MTDETPATVNNGRFTAGNPGRPKGSENKVAVLRDAIHDEDAKSIIARLWTPPKG